MLQKKFKPIFFVFFTFVILNFFLIKADVYVGTSEGYVKNTEGGNVADAKVIATVDRCIVSCSQETKTESTGYYVVANLNLPKFETLTVYAEKMTPLGLEFGSAKGTANEFQAARVDVLICLPPPQPTLKDEPNTHDTNVELEWTSYADKKGYSTFDEFQIDSGSVIKNNNPGTKKIDVKELSFSQHNWRVRTCNQYCCSNWVSDSFNVGNLPPSKPNLTDQLDTNPGKVSLSWISGTDPDGDETYDEYDFGIINKERKNLTNATSPQTEDVFSCNYYTWKVRTCERFSQNLCSEWSEDGFIACGLECPACTAKEEIFENCIIKSKQPYSLVLISPEAIEKEQKIPIKVNFFATENLQNIIFKVNSTHFNFNDYMINKIENKKATFEMLGSPKEDIKEGTYNLTFNVLINNRNAFSENFPIKIKEPLYIKIRRIIPIKKPNFWILMFIVIILGILSWIAYKKREELKNIFLGEKTKKNIKNYKKLHLPYSS